MSEQMWCDLDVAREQVEEWLHYENLKLNTEILIWNKSDHMND
jgi:hypothetical protein